MSNIGMMDTAYFVGRNELLQWINKIAQLEKPLKKIEDAASGAVYCVVLNALYGRVPLSKVIWDAKEYNYVKNWKIVQAVFEREKVEKVVPVERLIKGKYQDNLEFMQWMKRFYEIKGGSRSPAPMNKKSTTAKTHSLSTAQPKPTAATRTFAAKKKAPLRPVATNVASNKPAPPAVSGAKMKAELEKLRADVAELNETLDQVTLERNFYYEKLREVELLCEANEKNDTFKDFVVAVQEKIYAVDEEQ